MLNDDYMQILKNTIDEFAASDEGKEYKWLTQLQFAPDMLQTLCRLSVVKAVKKKDKARIAGAVSYFVSPIDLIPESIHGARGYADDVAIAAYVLSLVCEHSGEQTVNAYWENETPLPEAISLVLGAAPIMLAPEQWDDLKALIS